mmetsp:Transcript_8620/g.17467  ORF Transcript_8620/g.17467 Transcript_8620/m.17467 type:complete len:121 (-) Transcript_8620:606-968(-)
MDSIEEQEQRNWTQGEPIHLHFGTESSMGRGPGTGDCICAFTPGARAHGRQRWPCGDEERVYQQSLREGHCLQKLRLRYCGSKAGKAFSGDGEGPNAVPLLTGYGDQPSFMILQKMDQNT